MSEVWTTEQLAAYAAQVGTKSAARVVGGTRAQHAGKVFEEELERQHDEYRRGMIADIWKLPVETAPMPPRWLKGREGRGIGRILTTRQRFDYVGIMAGTGQMIAMEAKQNAEPLKSLPIVHGKGHGLKLHQLRALVNVAEYGGLAFLVWRNGIDTLVLPMERIQQAWTKLTRLPVGMFINMGGSNYLQRSARPC